MPDFRVTPPDWASDPGTDPQSYEGSNLVPQLSENEKGSHVQGTGGQSALEQPEGKDLV